MMPFNNQDEIVKYIARELYRMSNVSESKKIKSSRNKFIEVRINLISSLHRSVAQFPLEKMQIISNVQLKIICDQRRSS